MGISSRIRRNAAAGVLLFFFPLACAAPEREMQSLDIQLHVEVVSQDGREVPKFSLTITNVSSTEKSILDLRRRPDLQGTYADLEITAVGQNVEIQYYISDPGEIDDNDYTILQPSEEIKVETIPTAFVDALPAGTYQAIVQYWADPIKPTIYESPAVQFVIAQ